MWDLGKYLLLAFILAAALTPLVIIWSQRHGFYDRPDERKVHKVPVPRLGGAAIFAAFMITTALCLGFKPELWGFLAGGALIFAVGLYDDLKGLTPLWKLFGQVAAALIVVLAGLEIDFLTNPVGTGLIHLGYLGFPLTIFWIVGVTNALNLIDGLDGLAGGVGVIVATTLALVAYGQGQWTAFACALILAASVLGFLFYNFHPARIFMGDGGSQFLGFMLAVLSVLGVSKSATAISLFVPIIVLGIPIFDTLFAMVRRYTNGKPIFQADRGHLHHRLLGLGLGHTKTVLVIYAVSTAFSVIAILLTAVSTAFRVFLMFLLAAFAFWGINRIGVLRPMDKEIGEQLQQKSSVNQ